jgi:hypothetical protein
MRKCFASLIGESGLFPHQLYVMYYVSYISEATVARLLKTVYAVDGITSFSETSVCVLLVLRTCVAVKEFPVFGTVR